MIRDYAKTENMNAWVRHPVLGDPSFDTFERLGDTVHRSTPPYGWAVNGSLFCDFDGTWYYYAGLYGAGYMGVPARFRIYRSADKGQTWEDLGWGFDGDITFEGDAVVTRNNPDVFLTWDGSKKKYILTFDCSTVNWTREALKDIENSNVDSGAALALADTPAGPFERLPRRFLSNRRVHGSCGRWHRLYASCALPRKKDYIAFCLCDSDTYFAWALAVMTAPDLDGPWSLPHIVLSCDRPEYYPCPVEFFPVEIRGEKVVAHATSVALNRNYQAVWEADLEAAHAASAWHMTDDGNVWHAHDHPDEYDGIWGQTLHGFVEPDTGRYIVMHASRDEQNRGMLGLAWRPFAQPHSDGFVITGHQGPSVSPLKAAFKEFDLTAEFKAKGCVEFAFDYKGILGPNTNRFDATPHPLALSDYTAVRVSDHCCELITVTPASDVGVHGSQPLQSTRKVFSHARRLLNENVSNLRILRDQEGKVSVWANGEPVCTEQNIPFENAAPLAVVVWERSRLECRRFSVQGTAYPFTHKWNAVEAILGAGQLMPEAEMVSCTDSLNADRWHRFTDGFVGEGLIAGKWNVYGSHFKVLFRKETGFGAAGIWIDGHFSGSVQLDGIGDAVYSIDDLPYGPHAVLVRPLRGRIAITGCEAAGGPADKDMKNGSSITSPPSVNAG